MTRSTRYLIVAVAVLLIAWTPAPVRAVTLADLTLGTQYEAGRVTFTFHSILSLFSFQPGMGLDDVPIDFVDGGFILGTTFSVASRAEAAGVAMSFVVSPNVGTLGAHTLVGTISNADPNLVFITLGAGASALPHDADEVALGFTASVTHAVCSPFVDPLACRGHGSLSNPGITFAAEAAAIAEPATLTLLGGGLLVLAGAGLARR